jgi:hypothetical protein
VNSNIEASNFVFLHDTHKKKFLKTYENINYPDLCVNYFSYYFDILKYIFKQSVHMYREVELHFRFLRPISWRVKQTLFFEWKFTHVYTATLDL